MPAAFLDGNTETRYPTMLKKQEGGGVRIIPGVWR